MSKTKPISDSNALILSVTLNFILIGYALFTSTTTFQLWYNQDTKAYHAARAVEDYLRTQGVNLEECESTIRENKFVTVTCGEEVNWEYEVPLLI